MIIIKVFYKKATANLEKITAKAARKS